MSIPRVAAAALALAFAGHAGAQTTPKDLFKGKVREGLYEVKSEADLTGVPGMAKEAAKPSETKRRCMTRQEIERGVEAGKDCSVTSYKESPGAATIAMKCKDGSATDMKFTFGADTFTSELRTSGKDEGKPFVSIFRTSAKYVGACPPPVAPAPTTQPVQPAPPKK